MRSGRPIQDPIKKSRTGQILLYLLFFTLGALVMPLSVIIYRSVHNEGINANFVDKLVNFFSPRSYQLNFRKVSDIGSYLIHSRFVQVDELDLNTDFKNLNLFSYQLDNGPVRSTASKDFDESKGILKYKKEEYKVNFKPKGDRAIHYNKNKPSLKVHVRDSKALLGMSDFSLQSPVIRNYVTEYAWIRTLAREGFIVPNYGFLKLKINSKDYGIYSYEESMSTFMLERQGYKNSSIIGFDEASSTAIDQHPELKVLNQKDVPANNIKLGTSLLRSFLDGGQKVAAVFDVDKLATFFAIADVFQTHHGIVSKSVRFYYNPVKNLLEPIPFDGHAGSNIDNSFIAYDFTRSVNSWVSADSLWFRLFFNDKNKDFTKRYFEKLAKFASPDYFNSLLAAGLEKDVLNNLYKIYRDFPLEDRISYEGPYLHHFDLRTFINDNTARIRSKLGNQNIQVYSNLDTAKKELHIEVLNFSPTPYPLTLNELSSKNFKKKLVLPILEFDKSASRIAATVTEKTDSLLQDVAETNALEVNYSNAANYTVIKKVRLFPYDFQALSNDNNYLATCLQNNILTRRNDVLVFKSGISRLSDLLIIPSDYTLVIEPGATIEFSRKGAGIIAHGPALIRGSADKRIRLRGSGSGTAAGFLVFSENRNTDLAYTDFSNLLYPDSYDISGSLTFYKTEVKISDCSFNNNQAEDFLNIVNASFELRNITISGAKSDAIDLDFSNGKIDQLSIRNAKNDGVDASGSQVTVTNSRMYGIGDKCVSGGEGSVLRLEKIKLENSELGIVSKDGSKITGNQLEIAEVKVPVISFIKKKRYENPELVLANSSFRNFITRELIEKGITVDINQQRFTGALKDVSALLYGQQYGVKTIRAK